MIASRALAAMCMSGMLVVAVGAVADETRFASPPPAPRPATPPGRVLFADDFSSTALKGWRFDRDSTWSVWRGLLRADLPDLRQLRSLARFGDSTWTDYAVDLDFCMMRGVDKGVLVRVQGSHAIGVDVRSGGYQDVVVYRREWPMGKARVVNPNGVWHHLRVEARRGRLRVEVNGSTVLAREELRNPLPHGALALPAYTGGVGQCTVYYDNVVVTALD
jgi:hypothetical protein